MAIHVKGHYRVNPVSGKREWVDGYTRVGTPDLDTPSKGTRGASKGSSGSTVRERRSPAKLAEIRGTARLVQKRDRLLAGKEITASTKGWRPVQGRDGSTRLEMDEAEYESWLSNTIARASEAYITKGDTESRYKTEKNGTKYTAERKAQHKAVIETFMERSRKAPRERKAVLTGGRPGAGKSTSLWAQGITEDRYFTIDTDSIKEEMIRQGMAPDIEGLTPFESAGLIHEESADIASILIERVSQQGTNFVYDGTMAWAPGVEQISEELHSWGYSIQGIFVDVTPETAKRRALLRHKIGVENFLALGLGLGGRFVDPTIATKATNNRDNFESVKPRFDSWVHYDNEVDDRPPVLVAASGQGGELDLSNIQSYDTLENAETSQEVSYYLNM